MSEFGFIDVDGADSIEDALRIAKEKLKEMFPEMEIVDNLTDGEELFGDTFQKSVEEGLCIQCGKKMPNYIDWDWPDEKKDAWDMAEGWHYYKDEENDVVMAWQCPECNLKENVERN